MTRTASTFLFSTVLAMWAVAQERRIEYRWLNQPCSEVINCNAGCSACNVPENSDGVFFGTNAAFIGVATCPLPINVGDNAVFSAGWTMTPTADKTVIISGIAMTPLHIDSIIFRHAIYSNGPQRLKVEFTANVTNPPEVIADVLVPVDFEEVVLTDLGCVEFLDGSIMGTFQIRFTPYEGTSGGWALDEVRIVATSCESSQVGIWELSTNPVNGQGPWFDLLGRPMSAQPAPGVYISPTRRVRVF